MKKLAVPLSPFVKDEPVTVVFEKREGALDLEEAVRIGEQLFEVLYSQCPSILLRSVEQTLILHSPKIQELAEKANKWDDYYLQRLRRQEEEAREE